MSERTVYGPGGHNHPIFTRTEAEREEMMGRIAMGETRQHHAVNRQSATWQAIRAFIKQQVAEDYLPALRRKGMDHGQTEYARGAMDALDSLLQFGGEDV